MKNNSKIYNKIMETVSKQVKKTLDEVVITSDGSLAPKKVDITGEAYLILCSGVNKELLASVSSKLAQFDNQGAGSIRVICKTHDEVNKTIELLVNAGVLDADSFLGLEPKICIKKINKNSVNDSVNEAKEESDRIRIARQYMDPKKFWTPKQPAKLDIILKINNGELERTPEAIRAALDATGLWKDTSEGRIKMDIDLIMKKTGEQIQRDEPLEGEFIADYTYSRDSLEAEKWQRPYDCAVNHAKWLMNKGLDVRVEEGRYAYKYYITYHTKKQFDELVQWMAWHCGYTDSVSQPCPKEDKQYFIDMIKSGKKTTW